jgi:antirestriction protein ArdC
MNETFLQRYFWDFVDRGANLADTPLFTGIHGGEPLAAVIARELGLAARGGIRRRDRPEGGRPMNRDIYEWITARFIEQLKRGTVPWQKPWFGVQNIVSRKSYRGVNSLLLGSTDYQSPFWLSFKQALDLGGHVRKGEKSTPVIYYKILEKRDAAGNIVVRANGKPARVPFVRWANVFNLDQTEGIQAPAITANQDMSPPRERGATIVQNAKLCPIHHAGFAAYYSPTDDVIRIPAPSTFHSQKDYCHTLYHELTHASGHSTRLDREGIAQQARFGSEKYSKEDPMRNSALRSSRMRRASWTRCASRTRRPTWDRGSRSSKTIPS